MRAGPYATFEGRTYNSDFARGSPIRLIVPLSEPQPPGFERDGGRPRWVRRVERRDLERTFVVNTSARWKGIPVKVRVVMGGEADIEYEGPDYPDGPLSAGLVQEKYDIWTGTVPVDSLTDVVEEITDIPL